MENTKQKEPMNFIEANAVLVDLAHQALQSGVIKTFDHSVIVAQAVAQAKSFIDQTANDPKNGDFRPKMSLTDQEKISNTKLSDSEIESNNQLRKEEMEEGKTPPSSNNDKHEE